MSFTPYASDDTSHADAAGRARLMAHYFISFNGRHYQFSRFRYDRLADAVNYARLQRARSAGWDAPGPMPAPEQVEAPDAGERTLMAASAITFEQGVYHLGEYRYDRLADALAYVTLCARRAS